MHVQKDFFPIIFITSSGASDFFLDIWVVCWNPWDETKVSGDVHSVSPKLRTWDCDASLASRAWHRNLDQSRIKHISYLIFTQFWLHEKTTKSIIKHLVLFSAPVKTSKKTKIYLSFFSNKFRFQHDFGHGSPPDPTQRCGLLSHLGLLPRQDHRLP